MAEIRVVASLDNESYELNDNGNNLFSREIAAPERDTDVRVTAIDESGNESYAIELLDVNLEWLPPKIDWTSSDYFNAIDYNRIIGNLAFLRDYANKLFLELSDVTIKAEKNYMSLLYAREINVIEEELEVLNVETYSLDIGDKKVYKTNGKVPDYNEFNRIERACLNLYIEMKCHKENLPRLAFRLGNRNGIGGI